MKSVYIHIPFCSTICSYCDFCKLFYNEKWVDEYLNELDKEISLYYKNEELETIYIGGGTPSCLNINQLKKLFEIIIKFKKNSNVEITFECNIEVTEEKLQILKENKVNRISIGIQTFNEKHLKFLNRSHTKEEVFNKINLIKKYFDNINVDFIYAIPNQTLEEVSVDIDLFLKLNINHISTYSLIIEKNTLLSINNIKSIDEDLDYEMYQLINKKLSDKNYINYEFSNYGKPNYFSKHNLVYWNNEKYYGFGLGSSGYIDNIRYDNTRSLNTYLKGNYRLEEHILSKEEDMENYIILGLRKIEGISIIDFKNKYNVNLLELDTVNDLLKCKKLEKYENNIKINKEYLYVSNIILIGFIDLFK